MSRGVFVVQVVVTAALVAAVAAASFAAPSAPVSPVPSIPLKNAAVAGMTMPATGLGTGAYSANASVGYGGYPECWSQAAGCGPWALNATAAYIRLAASMGALPVRLDNANSYNTQVMVGQAMAQSGLSRDQIFLTSKVGSAGIVGSNSPMGYLDAKQQIAAVLEAVNVTYVDLMLIHWPSSTAPSQDAECNLGPSYNASACRLNTWRALVEAYEAGQILAIGVSNYNVSHLEEIILADMLLPSVNQIPIHLYRSSSQQDTIQRYQAAGVVVNSYSPFGVPDYHNFPTNGTGMSAIALQDPVALAIAKAHNRTPAAVIVAWLWQQGIVTNPRSMQVAHMVDNLSAYNITLSPAEMNQLSSRPQDWCSVDPTFYECAESASM